MALNEVNESFWTVKKFTVIIIVLILIVGGVLAYFLWPTNSENAENNFEEFSFLNSCLDSCSSCKQNCYDQDFMQQAESQVDESLCDNIKNQAIMQECLRSVIFIKAIQSKDVSMCDSIEDEFEKEMCINAVEASLNPPELEE